MKKSMGLLVTLIILSFICTAFSAEALSLEDEFSSVISKSIVLMVGSPKVIVKNEETLIDKNNRGIVPLNVNGKTMVPAGFLAESFGAKVMWDEKTQNISIDTGKKSIRYTLNQNRIIINNNELEIDAAPMIKGGTVLVPARSFVEALNKEIIYDRGLLIIGDDCGRINVNDHFKNISSLIERLKADLLPIPYNKSIISVGASLYAAIESNDSCYVLGSNMLLGADADKTVNSYRHKGDWSSVACGYLHTLLLSEGGTLWSWGLNDVGQLGNGTTKDNYIISKVDESQWEAVSTSYGHVIAMKKDGSLWGWGFNNAGQIGDGTKTNRSKPVAISKANDWKSFSAGDYFTTAIKKDGSLWSWGANNGGQLGDGTFVYRNRPVRIGSDSDWSMVDSGGAHSLAIKKDGSLWSWGVNSDGQLGNGEAGIGNCSALPQKVGSDNDWVYVSAGQFHSFAIESDGSLWEWGNWNRKSIPARVGDDYDWVNVYAGREGKRFLGVKVDGTVWSFDGADITFVTTIN